MSEFRAIMEVNFFAMVAMTKACLPLLKQCPGARVVNVTSFAGLFYGQPCMAAYGASKHASESFSTSLRHELKGWGIKVQYAAVVGSGWVGGAVRPSGCSGPSLTLHTSHPKTTPKTGGDGEPLLPQDAHRRERLRHAAALL